MQGCPCGYYGDPFHECTCSQASIDRYLGKISNPLLDRIDIHIEVLPVNYRELKDNRKIEGSKEIRDRVNRAREIQYHRYKEDNIFSNSELESRSIKKYCRLTPEAESIFKKAFNKYKFSARSYDKILKDRKSVV